MSNLIQATATKASPYTPALPLFAQLLAQENVKVRINEHATTASFDVHSRILTLPSWRGFDADAFNLFVVHEVGHALFTPPDWLDRSSLLDIAKRFGVTKGQVWTVMITLEDIRIERKIRAKYRGLASTFAKGYAELLRRDFFKFGPVMTAERWAKYGICDKLNLYGKVGALAGLKLTDPNHIAWYNEAVAADSYDDVIALAAKIIEWVKTNKKNQPKPETQDNHGAEDKPEPKQPKPQPKQEERDPSEKPEEGADDGAEGESGGEDLEAESEGTEPSGEDMPEPPKPTEGENEESDEESKGVNESDSDEDGDSEGSEKTESTDDLSGENDEESTESGDAAGDSDENEESEESTESDEESEADASKGDADGDSDENGDEESDEEGDGDASHSGEGTDPVDPATGADKEDTLESETKDAADETLKDAANGYTGGKKPVVLPIDLSFLNIADIDLKMLTDAWQPSPAARAIFTDLIAKHRRDASPILAAMVASFRQNQSASLARKTQTAKSGSVDMNRIASYKFAEDIFLRRAITAKGQNHGFVVNVDFSGSMDNSLPTVLWQLLHLVWFAETIKVPMEVYAFNTITHKTDNYLDHPINVDRLSRGKYVYIPEGRSICLYSTAAPAPVKTAAQAMILGRIYNHADVASIIMTTIQYSRTAAKDAAAQSKLSNRYVPIPAVSASDLTKKLSSFGDENWWNTVELHGYHWRNPIFGKLPMPVREAASAILSLSHVELTSATDHPMLALGGTPLHHALLAQAAVVRRFRERNRVEQCVSVWLTDGDDTNGVSFDDPRMIEDPTRIRKMGNNVVVSPATGKAYACETLNPIVDGGRVDMPIFLDLHRDLTGAAVVIVDLNADPSRSLGRVLSPEDIMELGAAIAIERDGHLVMTQPVERRGRFRRFSPRIKQIVVGEDVAKQSKKTVIIKKSKGSFSDAGIVSVDRVMFPHMGADAYVIADPTAFTENSRYAARTAAKIAKNASQSTGLDESVVRDTLSTQSAQLAMRRFSEILVPFLADNR